MIKDFDFEYPEFLKRGGWEREYLKENWNKLVSEEEFVAAVASWPKRELHNSRHWNASRARAKYKRLKKDYGFFIGEGK